MTFKLIDIYRRTQIVKLYRYYTNLLNNPIETHKLIALQKIKLTTFLLNLKSNNFYSNYLKREAIKEIESNPYKIIECLPIINKGNVTDNFDRIKNLDYKFEKSFTGGSTGHPFHYLIDKATISETRAFSYALWNKFLGYSIGDRVIVVAGSSLGNKDTIKKNIYNKLQNKHFVSKDEHELSETYMLVKLINKSKTFCFIYAYPSVLMNHIKIIQELNVIVDINKVKGVICTSEMLYENQRFEISTFFKVNVLNMYGANDGGIASGSIDNVSFYFNGLDCYAESLQIEGVNEIILTCLSSNAFPLVRYRVGDIGDVEYVESGYPFVIRNLIGRSRDLIYINKKKWIHGADFNKVFKYFPQIKEYQIEQYKDYKCCVKIVLLKPSLCSEIFPKLNNDISSLLSQVPFRIELVESITRTTSGKLKNIISHVS